MCKHGWVSRLSDPEADPALYKCNYCGTVGYYSKEPPFNFIVVEEHESGSTQEPAPQA